MTIKLNTLLNGVCCIGLGMGLSACGGGSDDSASAQQASDDNSTFQVYAQNAETAYQPTAYQLNSVATSGLLGYWSCDEQSGNIVADQSGQGNDGNLISPATWAPGFDAGGIMVIDGGGVQIDQQALQGIGEQLTISLFVRIDDPSVDGYMRLVSCKDDWHQPKGFELEYNPVSEELNLISSGQQIAQAHRTNLGTTWHHITVLIHGEDARLYVDGTERTTIGTIDRLKAPKTDLWVGRNHHGGGRLNGVVDELRIYNRVISPSEFQALSGSRTGLVAHWSFDEQTGTVAGDLSGHGHDATLMGEAAWIPDGAIGGAIRLEHENAWLETANGPGLAITGQLGMSAWIRIADAELNTFMRILSKKIAYDDAIGYELEYNPALNVLTVTGGSGNVARAENVDLPANEWHHVAAMVDGTSAKLYVDGIETASDGTLTALRGGELPLNIGRLAGEPYAYFTGDLDDLQLFDLTVADRDIQQQVAAVRTDTVAGFRWARQHYSPVLQRPTTMAANGIVAGVSLTDGDAVSGSLDTVQWSGANAAGKRGWSSNTLVGPAGIDYWIRLRSWDLVSGEAGDVFDQHQAQDAQLRLARYADDISTMPVLHGIGISGGNQSSADGLVLALAFRYQPAAGNNGSAKWQLGDYNGNPVQCGLWRVPAGYSLGQAQKDDSLLVEDLTDVLSDIDPQSAPAFRLDVDADGVYRLSIDTTGDTLAEHTFVGGVPLSFPADDALVISTHPAGGATSGKMALGTIGLDYQQVGPDAVVTR